MGILATAISQHPNPSCILAVNRYFNDIGQFIIYTSLRFKSESQLVKFALRRRFHVYHHANTHRTHHRHEGEDQEGSGTPTAVGATFSVASDAMRYSGASDIAVRGLLPYPPQSISVRIPGGQGSGITFSAIKHVFELCAAATGTGILAVDSLEFCLHSHTSDPTPWRIGEALSLVKYVSSPVASGSRKLTRCLDGLSH